MPHRICSQCELSKPTYKFSSRQLHKGVGFSRCRDCASSHPSHPSHHSSRKPPSTSRHNYPSAARFRRRDLQHPFEEGGFRYVALGRQPSPSGVDKLCVAKWFKSGSVTSAAAFRSDILCVSKAIELVRAFNGERVIDARIRVNVPQVREFGRATGLPRVKYMLERYIHGYDKWNSNSGWADTSSEWALAMQALSHFSYHRTGGQYLLCDLQGGVDDGEGPVLSDPAILSREMRFGMTDLGREGIANFFALHRCNKYCRRWSRPRARGARRLFGVQRGTTFVGFPLAGETTTAAAASDGGREDSLATRETVRTAAAQTDDDAYGEYYDDHGQQAQTAQYEETDAADNEEEEEQAEEQAEEQTDDGEETGEYYEGGDGNEYEYAEGERSSESEDDTGEYYYYYDEDYQQENVQAE